MSHTTNPAGDPIVTVTRDSTTQATPTEYDRFESLARRVVAVPKEEIDEEREANA